MITVEALLTLPWTIRPSEQEYEGEGSFELSVVELEGFVVCGSTEAEVRELFWPALRVFLESFVSEGELPPLPAAVRKRMVAQSSSVDGLPSDYPLEVERVLEGVQPGRIGMTKVERIGGREPVTL